MSNVHYLESSKEKDSTVVIPVKRLKMNTWNFYHFYQFIDGKRIRIPEKLGVSVRYMF